ncbi:hypothetical protein C8R46DRAFT_1027274 [Mycena filopes]|nr:hypothetical protein C8R46DRAFT_1027274 [Mycena filopes]
MAVGVSGDVGGRLDDFHVLLRRRGRYIAASFLQDLTGFSVQLTKAVETSCGILQWQEPEHDGGSRTPGSLQDVDQQTLPGAEKSQAQRRLSKANIGPRRVDAALRFAQAVPWKYYLDIFLATGSDKKLKKLAVLPAAADRRLGGPKVGRLSIYPYSQLFVRLLVRGNDPGRSVIFKFKVPINDHFSLIPHRKTISTFDANVSCHGIYNRFDKDRKLGGTQHFPLDKTIVSPSFRNQNAFINVHLLLGIFQPRLRASRTEFNSIASSLVIVSRSQRLVSRSSVSFLLTTIIPAFIQRPFFLPGPRSIYLLLAGFYANRTPQRKQDTPTFHDAPIGNDWTHRWKLPAVNGLVAYSDGKVPTYAGSSWAFPEMGVLIHGHIQACGTTHFPRLRG